LENVDSFSQWGDTIRQAAKKKCYYPQLNDIVIDSIQSDAQFRANKFELAFVKRWTH